MPSVIESDLSAPWEQFRNLNALFVKNANELYRGIRQLLQGIRIKVPEDNTIYCLAAASLRDFDEILVLAGHGFGIGASKILRGLYERTVILSYLSEHVDEVNLWIDYSNVNWSKLMREGEVAAGKADWLHPDDVEAITRRFEDTKSKFTQHNRRGVRPNWTQKSVPQLATEVSEELRRLYFNGFLSPTLFVHPTFVGLAMQFEFIATGVITVNRKIEDEEITVALGFGAWQE